MKRRQLLAILLLAPGLATAQSIDAGWAFAVTPYVWLPSVSGTLSFAPPPGTPGGPEVGVGTGGFLQHLEAALMLSAEARKGDWTALADVIYLDFSKQGTALKGMMWQFAASRALGPSLEVLGGVRHFGVEASVDRPLAGGSLSQKEELLDAIVGVRGRVRLGDRGWFLPYYLDAGAGSSSLTWQGAAGVGHAFKWGEALLTYRHLYYDQKSGKLLQGMEFSGPALGVRLRF
jgi:hypothetical protein